VPSAIAHVQVVFNRGKVVCLGSLPPALCTSAPCALRAEFPAWAPNLRGKAKASGTHPQDFGDLDRASRELPVAHMEPVGILRSD